MIPAFFGQQLYNLTTLLIGPVSTADGKTFELRTVTESCGSARWWVQRCSKEWGWMCLPLLWLAILLGKAPMHPPSAKCPFGVGQRAAVSPLSEAQFNSRCRPK